MIYLTRLVARPPNASWPWGSHCKMFSEGVEETIRFASMLGIESKWLCWAEDFPPFFRLAQSKRNTAIALGAVVANDAVLEEFVCRAQAGEWCAMGGRVA